MVAMGDTTGGVPCPCKFTGKAGAFGLRLCEDIGGKLEDGRSLQRVRADFVVQVFDYPKLQRKSESTVFPTKAVVQGSLDNGRRDYNGLFTELVERISGQSNVASIPVALIINLSISQPRGMGI